MDAIEFSEQGIDVAIYDNAGLLEIILEDDCLDRHDGSKAELRLHTVDDALRIAAALILAAQRTLSSRNCPKCGLELPRNGVCGSIGCAGMGEG